MMRSYILFAELLAVGTFYGLAWYFWRFATTVEERLAMFACAGAWRLSIIVLAGTLVFRGIYIAPCVVDDGLSPFCAFYYGDTEVRP